MLKEMIVDENNELDENLPRLLNKAEGWGNFSYRKLLGEKRYELAFVCDEREKQNCVKYEVANPYIVDIVFDGTMKDFFRNFQITYFEFDPDDYAVEIIENFKKKHPNERIYVRDVIDYTERVKDVLNDTILTLYANLPSQSQAM